VTVTYETEASALLPYIPKELVLLKPEITVTLAQNRQLPWLGGRTYNLISVSVPVFHSASSLNTSFAMVLWENMTEPILSGRESTGVSKLFADIEYTKVGNATKTVTASWDKTSFLRFSTDAVLPPFPVPYQISVDEVMLRTFPKPGSFVDAEVYEWVHYPTDVNVTANGVGAACSVEWLPGRTTKKVDFMEMPTQFHIINVLASIPVVRTLACAASTSSDLLRNDLSGVLTSSSVVLI
jgi:acetoacetate decarboxylase